jgi:hypothetical protein
MEQTAHAPLSCRLETLTGECAPDAGLCTFEFPWCEGCPKSSAWKTHHLEKDPMTSAIWRGWINGTAGMEKYIHGENLAFFKKRVAEEHNPAQREILLRLFSEEQARDHPPPKNGK